MKLNFDLNAPPSIDELSAHGTLALFVDFDGTLVDIAETPGEIHVGPSLAMRLVALSDMLGGRLALVSGRAIDDLEHHCGRLEIALAGSHGAARRTASGETLGLVASSIPERIVSEIEDFAGKKGVMFELKAHGAALHSRSAPILEAECASFLDSLATRHGLIVKRGKKVAELVSPGADKGAAVENFMELQPFTGARPIFIGDDITDEDGFAACTRLGGFGIAVGDRKTDLAEYALADPAAVQRWLQL